MRQSPSISMSQLELTGRKRENNPYIKANDEYHYNDNWHMCENDKFKINVQGDELKTASQRCRMNKRKKVSGSDNVRQFRDFSHRAARVSSRIRKIKYPEIRITPLMAAAMEGHIDSVRELLKKKKACQDIEINFQHQLHDGSVRTKWSALRYACHSSKLEIIQMLLDGGASITEVDLPRNDFSKEVQDILIKEEYRRKRLAFIIGSISPQSAVQKACFKNKLYDKNAISMIFDFVLQPLMNNHD